MKNLISKGVSITSANIDGYQPFHKAVESSNEELMKLLLDQDPNLINIKSDYGQTPLHLAAKSSDINTMIFLLENNADPNIPNRAGMIALDILLEKKDEYKPYFDLNKTYNNPDLLDELEMIKINEFSLI